MDCFYLACNLRGPSFSPAQVEVKSGLKLSKKNEPGELGAIGKYRDKPKPYGHAVLVAPEDMPFSQKLTWITNIIKNNIETFRRCGAEDIVLDHAYYHAVQCNHEFTPEQLKKISDFGIPLIISCYRISEEDSE